MAHKEHHAKVVKAWREKNPDKIHKVSDEWRRDYYRQHRDAVFEKLGRKCVRCGIDDQRVLCIDHVHGGGTKESRALGLIKLMKKVLDDEGGNYQILCHNCNWIKRYENREAFGWGKHQQAA